MELQKEITQMKQETLAKVGKAAKEHDVAAVVSHTKVVERLDKLQSQLEQIAEEFASLKRRSSVPKNPGTNRGVSRVERGRLRRSDFIKRASEKGVALTPVRGVQCSNEDGGIVGIAYASERAPNKWWLGLPKTDYASIVLLCEGDQEQITSFIFPREFYERYEDSFSIDRKHTNLKFNIGLRGGRYVMRISGLEDIYINEYVDAFNNLR